MSTHDTLCTCVYASVWRHVNYKENIIKNISYQEHIRNVKSMITDVIMFTYTYKDASHKTIYIIPSTIPM